MTYLQFIAAWGAGLRRVRLARLGALPRPLVFVLMIWALAVLRIMADRALLPTVTFPACDDAVVLKRFEKLYDNRRLLHAVRFSNATVVKDSATVRRCAVDVVWGDGSQSVLRYEYDYDAQHGGHLSLWVDLNGGMLW